MSKQMPLPTSVAVDRLRSSQPKSTSLGARVRRGRRVDHRGLLRKEVVSDDRAQRRAVFAATPRAAPSSSSGPMSAAGVLRRSASEPNAIGDGDGRLRAFPSTDDQWWTWIGLGPAIALEPVAAERPGERRVAAWRRGRAHSRRAAPIPGRSPLQRFRRHRRICRCAKEHDRELAIVVRHETDPAVRR